VWLLVLLPQNCRGELIPPPFSVFHFLTTSVAQKMTMRALRYHGPGNVSIDHVPLPKILEPTDVILKVEDRFVWLSAD
jgi:hypothetical protein